MQTACSSAHYANQGSISSRTLLSKAEQRTHGIADKRSLTDKSGTTNFSCSTTEVTPPFVVVFMMVVSNPFPKTKRSNAL